jgi:hypothetical protein
MVRRFDGLVACALLLALAAAGCSRGKPAHGHAAARSPVPAAQATGPAVVDSVTFDARFSTIDNDDDGQIDFGEYAASATGRFVTMDLDGNGLVTPEEMDAHRAALGRRSTLTSAQVIQPVDSDGDGKLAQWENETIARRLFDTIDSNHDDVLSRQEARAHASLLDATDSPPAQPASPELRAAQPARSRGMTRVVSHANAAHPAASNCDGCARMCGTRIACVRRTCRRQRRPGPRALRRRLARIPSGATP